MNDTARFLGFAFANADFLFEVDRGGKIVFAAGATHDFMPAGQGELVGMPAVGLFQPSAGAKFTILTHALSDGDRAGPVELTLAGGSPAALAMFRLPQNNGHVSCTLTRPGAHAAANSGTDPQTGLSNRDGFLAAAAGLTGGSNEISLVNVPALREASARLSRVEADTFFRRIGEAIRQTGPAAAARLSDTSFGAIAQAAGGSNRLGQSIRQALLSGGVDTAGIEETLISLRANGLSADQHMLALRYVLDRFATQAGDLLAPHDLTAAFDELMNTTQDRALALTQTVADGSFSLAFQPIVDLNSGAIPHYEALARFAEGADTGEIVGFAESLGIADAFDLAVAMKVIAYLGQRESGTASVAFNVSGRTLASPPAFGLLAGLLVRNRRLRSRLLIEITETAEITDIATANKAIQTIRDMGFHVGLDDFGAGAASLQYLHGFQVDFVKLDGALVKKLGASARDDIVLRGVVKLCDELGVRTIAECIETENLLKRARDIGFGFGQGHLFGQPLAALPASQPAARDTAVRAKRHGLRESWE
jgi:EAL domain-containing protein (putative c-di-GMP-specific phosphodiesterase class I)